MLMYIEQKDACIGIVDWDNRQVRTLRSSLKIAGFSKIHTGANPNFTIDFLEEYDPDLLVLADGPFGQPSEQVIPEARQFNAKLSVIYIGESDDEDRIVRVLKHGADDYLIKGQFGKRLEFPARAKALLRRANHRIGIESPSEIKNGDLTINFPEHLITKGEDEIDLTPTEYRIISELARNVGRTLTHSEILTRCWGSEFGKDETHLVAVNICRLRAKLDDNTEGRYILTQQGVGYKMQRLTPI